MKHLRRRHRSCTSNLRRRKASGTGGRGLASWRSVLGGQGSFQFPKAGFYAIVRVDRFEADRCVGWTCTDSKYPDSSGFDNLRDWIGTRLRFEIEPVESGKSRLIFTHAGLGPLECFGVLEFLVVLFERQPAGLPGARPRKALPRPGTVGPPVGGALSAARTT